MKNAIFLCTFYQEEYLNLLNLFLESLYIYGNLDNQTSIIIYTSSVFMEIIKNSNLNSEKLLFCINDTYNSIEDACFSRLDFFDLPIAKEFDRILYLDIDILVINEINSVFELLCQNKLYTLEEGTIDNPSDFWGKTLFGNEVNNYADKRAFSSGILLFNNTIEISNLFRIIRNDRTNRPHTNVLNDQPYFVYNTFKLNLQEIDTLKNVAFFNRQNAIFNELDLYSDKKIVHFCEHRGHKLSKMKECLYKKKDYTINNLIIQAQEFINSELLPIIHDSHELLEGNVFMVHQMITYKSDYKNKVSNLCSLVMNKNIHNILEIGFNAGFSALLFLLSNDSVHITCVDNCSHQYTLACSDKIKNKFGNRFQFIQGDSQQVLQSLHKSYNLIHIDGCRHASVAKSDIIQSYRLSKKETILVMDDYNFAHLKIIWDESASRYNLQNLSTLLYDEVKHDIKMVPTKSIKVINCRQGGNVFHYAHFLCDLVFPEVIAGIYNYDVVYRQKNLEQTIGNFAGIYRDIFGTQNIEVSENQFDQIDGNAKVVSRFDISDPSMFFQFRDYIFNRFSIKFDSKYPKNLLIERGDRICLIDDAELKRINTNITTGKERREIKDIDLLKLRLSDADFHSIQLETLPFHEQVKYFYNAENIIAAHGAGLSNLFFCRSGTVIIEIHCNIVWSFFDNISKNLGLNHYKCENEIDEIMSKLKDHGN
jgi:predicted O-methyltransferase YrrM